jgi:hypothetical protein
LVLSDWLLYICSLVEFAPAKNRIQHFSYILVEFFRFLAVSASYLIMNNKRIKLTQLITKVVVFKDLQKLVQHSQQENTRKELFQKLQNKPFWIWNIAEHKQEDIKTNGDCCFNHIIGLPQRNGIDKPLIKGGALL